MASHPVGQRGLPGRWFMIVHLGEPYGEITLVKRGEQRGYRADRTDETCTSDVASTIEPTKRSVWQIVRDFLRGGGSGDNQLCALCGTLVTPETRWTDINDAYCSEDHYFEGLANRTW